MCPFIRWIFLSMDGFPVRLSSGQLVAVSATERSSAARWTIRGILVAAGAIYCGWGPLTVLLFPASIDPFGERLAVLGLSLAFFGVSFIRKLAPHLIALLYVLAFAGVGHYMTLVARNEVSPAYLAGAFILVGTASPVFTTPLGVMTFDAFVLGAAIWVTGTAEQASEGMHLMLILGLVTMLFAIALSVLRNFIFEKSARRFLETKIEQLRAAQTEVNQLKGLLPICMHCSQIRDSAGDWQRVDAYVAARTDATFTHSVCPRCLDINYPETRKSAG